MTTEVLGGFGPIVLALAALYVVLRLAGRYLPRWVSEAMVLIVLAYLGYRIIMAPQAGLPWLVVVVGLLAAHFYRMWSRRAREADQREAGPLGTRLMK